MDDGQEDFKSLPLLDRLQHKLWKARVSAYEELKGIFDKTDNDSDFYTYESYLKKIATDANAVAQEAGLNAIYAYVDNAPNASSSRETVVPALVEKCLGAPKAGTKQKATDIILLYAEVDVADPVVELVLPGLGAKQPKLVTQVVVVLKEFVRQYGIKKVSPKPILKTIPKMFGHTDKNVRAEASALTIELYRWLGPALNQQLSGLKPVQIKELEEAFSKLPAEKPAPERLLRSEQEAAAAAAANEVEMGTYLLSVLQENGLNCIVDEAAEEGNDAEPMEEEPIDPYDLADPVDITSKLPSDFYELLASKNWKQRREALDALMESTKTPKIMDKDYSELMAALAKRVNDANVLLVGTTVNCIEAIATGLRLDFGKYKAVIAPPMLEKLKERKAAVLEQISNALNAVFASVPLSEIIEDITAGTKNKNPQVRGESIKLVTRRLKDIRTPPPKGEIKAFAELMLKTLDDADGNAREASAEGLGTLMKVVGEKGMSAWTDGLDEIKMGKIKEAYEKAEVKAKPIVVKKAAPPPKKAPPVKKKAPPKPAAVPKEEPEPMVVDDVPAATAITPPKRKPPARAVGGSAKKPALSSSKPKAPAPSSAAPKKAAKLPPLSGPEEVKYRFTPEDAEARVNEYIPEQIWNDIAQSQWKIRLAAMESLHDHFENLEASDIEAEIVFRCLAKKPGWKEMNFQVMGKLFGVMQLLASKCTNFSKACAAIGIPGLVEKLGDIKLKKAAGECLVAFAEKTSLQFVFSLSYPIWKKAKSPKVLADSLIWIHSSVMEFGIAGLQVRDLIDFLKSSLSNTNAAVRTSAVTVLGALRLYIGPGIDDSVKYPEVIFMRCLLEVKSFVQDVTPALMATIEAEFDKVAEMEPPKPTKGPAEDESGGGSDAIESLFPRADISGQLNKTSSQCNDSNWKVRKEGLDKVLTIINDANKRIKPTLGDFPGILKQRLADSNKNLQIVAVEIAGLLAVSMGKPFEKYLKPLAGPVTAVLSDNKASVRAAGVVTLEHFRTTCGLEGMIGAFATSLAADSPALRKELLTWLSTVEDASACDLSPLISPTLSCLQDRNAEVRKAAQACLPAIVASAGYDTVVQKTADLKGAQRQTIMPMIEAVRGSAPAGGATAASVSAKRAPAIAESKRPESASSNVSDEKPASRLKPLAKKKVGLPAPRSGAPPASSAAASAPSAEQAQAPVMTSDLRAKQVRAKKENKWQFDSPRSDIIDTLRALCDANMSSDVCGLLFSTSQYAERDRLNGLGMLDECIAAPEVSMDKYGIDFSDMKQRYVANADLILKYLTIRFFDTNTSMLIKCLDVTEHLVAVLDEEGYHFSEYEAVSFLPFLINKVGDPKEVMRARVRGIFTAICRIYPASKLINYLLDAASNSKNAKTRAECLEEVGTLIQRNGMSVMLPNKALPLIAIHIGDRDAGVRNAALSAIAQAYILIGDTVFKYMSRLGEKEKGMLEERLKRTKPSASVIAEKEAREKREAEEMEIDELPSISQLPRVPRSQIGKPRSSAHAPPPQRQVQHSYDPEPMEDVTDDYGRSVGSRSSPNPSSMRQARPSTQHVFQQERGAYIVDYIIAQITSGEPQPSIDALKQLDKLLNSKPELILPDIEPLMNAITLQVRLAYETVDPQAPATTRLCKHLVNTLVLLFSNKDLACAISQDALHHLLQELAYRLLDQRMPTMESGPQLSKALNVAMVKVALLSILGTCSADLRPGDSPTAKETKYTELIMKCLWKLAKTIQGNLHDGLVNADELLFEINRFFITTPPAEWKRRATENVPLGEIPLRTVKTLLLEMVNGLGDSVFQHLTLIEDPQRSSVYPYLHHMLEACRKKERMQQQQQQQPSNESFMTHSRNSSLSRPPSISSLKSNGMGGLMRSPSMASYPSSEGQAEPMGQGITLTEAATAMAVAPSSQSPRLASSSLNQVQPMQVDEQVDGPKVLSDYEMNNLLKQIFVKIGARDQTKQGIAELYEFQKKYPLAETKVNAFLGQTGTYFQSYIRRGLSNLAAEDNELRASTPVSVVSTDLQNQSPRTASPPAHEYRQSIDMHQSPGDRISIHGDDAMAIKQRLLRLQQKFGYKAEVDEAHSGQSVSGAIGSTSTTPEPNIGKQDTSSTFSTSPKRRMSSLNNEPSTLFRTSSYGEADRAQSVSALKERLAKMKQIINSAASSASNM
ncbi:Microtubule-associated protein, microtubule dynamics during spindle orientation [Apophysomyces sp. BC1034]|nr:Microtubule-associated protein, microtubule dynamics during spindle orientation [Apophysomyces sp. BC1015]KAG0178408.1 Microtubule-associated protein, microtubule dynamics during spindle orientation [Apophysomyces sp. BC1021]KAG0188796.1 Microtubule-associated protein, microtubule dynamics during spindle orientation [Apophysomyces sp. BC1034]